MCGEQAHTCRHLAAGRTDRCFVSNRKLDILTPAFLKIGLALAFILALALVLVPGCQTTPPPGCTAYAKQQVAEFEAKGMLLVGYGPAGSGADYVMFLDPTTGTVDAWVSRIEGSDGPTDAQLEADGFERVTVCTWDGAPLPPGFGPGGEFWHKSKTKS